MLTSRADMRSSGGLVVKSNNIDMVYEFCLIRNFDSIMAMVDHSQSFNNFVLVRLMWKGKIMPFLILIATGARFFEL